MEVPDHRRGADPDEEQAEVPRALEDLTAAVLEGRRGRFAGARRVEEPSVEEFELKSIEWTV